MKQFIQLLLTATFLSFNSNAQTVVNNQRTPNHLGIKPIKLSLVPPPNYTYSENESVFTRNGEPAATAKYQVNAVKILWPYRQIRDSLTQGVNASFLNYYKINNYDGVLINQSQGTGIETANTFILVFGNSTYSYILSGFCPSSDGTAAMQIKNSILSAYVDTFGYQNLQISVTQRTRLLNPQPTLSPRFEINTAGSTFVIAEEVGDMIRFYTNDGAFPSYGVDKSFIKIIKTSSIVSPGNYEEFSRSLLTTYVEFNSIDNIRGNLPGTQIDSMNGYELLADAVSSDNIPLQLYQLCLFSTDAVYILLGARYTNQTTTSIEKLRLLFNTFKRN